MKKLSYILFTILCTISLFSLTSCNTTKKRIKTLEKAYSDIQNSNNYTMNVVYTIIRPNNEKMILKINAMFDGDKIIMNSGRKYFDENDFTNEKMLGITTEDTISLYTYNKNNNTWRHYKDTNANAFKKERGLLLPKLEISENSFKYENDVYVGNNELLMDMLSEYLTDMFNDLTDGQMSISKYTITLNKKSLDKIELSILVTEDEENATINIDIDFSNIGSTTINAQID